jgi:hypothetical protein
MYRGSHGRCSDLSIPVNALLCILGYSTVPSNVLSVVTLEMFGHLHVSVSVLDHILSSTPGL